MSRFPHRRSLLGLLLALAPAVASAEAIQSPWWEDYAIRDRYLCRPQGVVVLERNDAQASLIQGRYRSTFFREASDEAGIRYSGDDGMRLHPRCPASARAHAPTGLPR